MQSLRHIAHITVGSIHLITNDTGLENTAGNTLNAHRTDNVVRISPFQKARNGSLFAAASSDIRTAKCFSGRAGYKNFPVCRHHIFQK